jgi:hypothetical protein
VILMGIRKMCDCSGTANLSNEGFQFSANICPSCFLKGSVVTLNLENFSFSSNSVDLPSCILADDGGILTTKGTGTVTTGGETIPVTFTLTLVDGPGENDDAIIFTATGFDAMGEPVIFLILLAGLPEESVTVTSCNSTPIDNGLKSHKTIRNITNGITEMKLLSKGKWHYYNF